MSGHVNVSQQDLTKFFANTFLEELRNENIGSYAIPLPEFRDRPVEFVKEILRVTPTKEQVEILTAVNESKKPVARKSGHGVGKTSGMAMLIWWFLQTRFEAQIACTAPTAHQLKDRLWAEIAKWHNTMIPKYRDIFKVVDNRVYHKQYDKSWYAVGRTSRKEEVESFQGWHAEHFFALIDEGSGVLDSIIDVLFGALTMEDNHLAMFSNPTRLSGGFHRAFHQDKKFWNLGTYSSRDSKLVKPSYIKYMENKFGKKSNIVRIRVDGRFPLQEKDAFIPRELVEKAMSRLEPAIPKKARARFGVDVGMSDTEESSVIAHRVENIVPRTMDIAEPDLMKFADLIKLHTYKESTIDVDVIGVGAGVVHRCKQMGMKNVRGVNVANQPDMSKSEKKRKKKTDVLPHQLRDQLWMAFLDWLRDEEPWIEEDNDLLEQLCSPKFSFTPSGRLKIESKDSMRKRGVSGLHKADAVMLTFVPDLYKKRKAQAVVV